MTVSSQVTGGDVEQAAASVCRILSQSSQLDWSARAGSLRWSCLRTAWHIGDTLLAYACQIATGYQEGWVPFRTRLAHDATPPGTIVFVQGSARMLSAAARSADPGSVAFHPFGLTDVEGFLALGCGEVLVHGFDIASGLGIELAPDRDLCEKVLNRLMPGGCQQSSDPWERLLIGSNRKPSPSGQSNRRWQWRVRAGS